ncbi:TPA: DNA mismatch repair protein MutT [candidate division CPR2 bacterium]|uniref:Oxidized purine nucleoside triphosphate hydrolase n=1 Tax=candidate division CPR2 bacterium GW2011_GWC1_41_48 TaxID=1618344 RepID=A0A0G0YJU7_UNCC2|nr:MAG: 7,8-dihydro-8-oxoguanine triphosphatase [candidate division CPR2 bacterium GW2011_GWC2_39_35]KKR28099.1 MAG: 7,8-dihydro-8-oxoguanine triphosphatase [candidate division CPR2 bacterium GW2011_GWD1_39_7]KKR28131.1 MAG: 7,8-dihydro-8-oxoguanine triphosphatase [candidate division CPR2 bacterium GW2011_GWD2_39_7]KKS09811.1 MAG: 7,8-dihydro-8-oxoguanine triphosphatase [candidate division CPR2 bacterium GW2011_GWC1_41_48]OGB60295.1 MAG: hypothetical protein A2Y27_01500 [candidate division CPR2
MKNDSETTKRVTTLCTVLKDDQILLGLKKKGFGKGKWNGFGGKVEKGESVYEAAKRELEEEICIKARDMTKRGIIIFDGMDEEIIEVHFFSLTKFEGTPTETNEMKPKWFNLSDIPDNKMWLGDQYWLPMLLEGKNFIGIFYFDGPDKLIDYKLEEIIDKAS